MLNSIEEISKICDEFDAIILDLPEHAKAISSISNLLRPGVRIACYCPVTSQIERGIVSCD